jgi:D-alanyl-D-alanine dipeptidase
MKPKKIIFSIVIFTIFFTQKLFALPTDFVYLKSIDPTIIQDMRYVTSNNFLGRPITGYHAATCILTRETAEALSTIQKELRKKSLSLKVYDCYRPKDAVSDFMAWSKDIHDQKQKNSYYPNIDKADFFKLGYVVEKSGHTRGSTVDLTIVKLEKNHKSKELNMATHFDFMDPTSHPLNEKITGEAKQNRLFLRAVMLNAGFKPLKEEWWHFTLKNEPYPDTYFNFPVE